MYVTHDQGEAMSLADRIGVMRGGRLEQSGEPALLYESPFTDFDPKGVAGVFGQADANAVITILRDVRKRAAA